MLHVDELQDLHVIPLLLQQVGPQGVRDQCRHALPDHAVAQDGRKLPAPDLAVQLMLAAGHRQDHAGSPLYGLLQGIVRGLVAGVEGDHHVHLLPALIVADVPLPEAQAIVMQLFGQLTAAVDHIRFQIQPGDPDVPALEPVQIIVHAEGQIGLPAAEIHDADGAVCGKLLQHILDELQITVDLPELIIFRPHHLPLGRLHSQAHQEVHRLPLGQDVALGAVVGHVRKVWGFRVPALFGLDGHCPLSADQDAGFQVGAAYLRLPEQPLHISCQAFLQLLPLQVPVEHLRAAVQCLLEAHPSPDEHRAQLHLGSLFRIPCIAQCDLYDILIRQLPEEFSQFIHGNPFFHQWGRRSAMPPSSLEPCGEAPSAASVAALVYLVEQQDLYHFLCRRIPLLALQNPAHRSRQRL